MQGVLCRWTILIFLHTNSTPNVDIALDLNSAAGFLDLCGIDPNLTNQFRIPCFVCCPQILSVPLISVVAPFRCSAKLEVFHSGLRMTYIVGFY